MKSTSFLALAALLPALPILGQSSFNVGPALDAYNVSWNAPGPTSSQSMPIGNGDIGLNVWVEPSGDLAFFIAKTDSWGPFNPGPRGLMKVFSLQLVRELVLLNKL